MIFLAFLKVRMVFDLRKNLFNAEKFKLLAHRADAECDAGGVGGIGGYHDIRGLHGDLVSRLADSLDAGIGVFNVKGDVAQSTAAKAVGGVGEYFKIARAGVKHHTHAVSLSPFASDGQTKQSVGEIDELVEVFDSVGLQGNVVNSCDLGCHIKSFQPRRASKKYFCTVSGDRSVFPSNHQRTVSTKGDAA